jgi:hypothetical protein
MKLNQVAAFALMGWYLMIPQRQGSKIDIDVPIALWPHLDSFDSAAECRNAGLDAQKRVADDPQSTPARRKQYAMFECIATDDPRLKGR